MTSFHMHRGIRCTSQRTCGSQNDYLSFIVHWWQPEDLRSGRALVTGLQGEVLVLSPGCSSILLQTRDMEAQVMVRNIGDEFLSTLQQWAPEGEVIHGHMVTDAGRNMLAALNAADFEGFVYMVHKLHLVVCNTIGLGSHVKPRWDTGTREKMWTLLEQCCQLVGLLAL